MGTKPDSVSWDPRTRVSFPRRPERVEAVQGGHPDSDEPFAVATNCRGTKAYFIRDNADQWHRVSEATFNLVVHLAANTDSPVGLSIEAIEGGDGLNVYDGAALLTMATLPFNQAAA